MFYGCSPLSSTWRLGAAALLVIAWLGGAAGADETQEHPGALLYQQKCASCHGEQGEGTSEYNLALVGDRPAVDLAKYIDEMMPLDDPDDCRGDEAEQVARYIYDAFYSPVAQARKQTARVDLQRLTVRQHQQAVADIVETFRWRTHFGDERGVKVDYYNGRGVRKDRLLKEETVPQFGGEWGESGPPVDNLNQEEHMVRWRAGLFVPETGEYEFSIRVNNGAKLWVNDTETPLIDAWVRSGDHSEYKETIQLLGGRVYPIRFELYRAKSDKSTEGTLTWRPPRRVAGPIPTAQLAPLDFAEVFVLNTPFPPDDRSRGFERGSAVSKEWQQAVTHAALETAEYLEPRLPRLAGYKHDADAETRAPKLREFSKKFVERAFRRPLDEEQRQFFIDRLYESSDDPTTAARLSVILALTSPRFLYHDAASDDPHAVASRLSFALWDALPDEELRRAANENRLQSREQVAEHAWRMLGDLRTRAKVREFFHVWLQLESLHDVAKDAERFADFNDALVSDLRRSLDLQLDDAFWSGAADFRTLLLAEELFLNDRLADYYGAKLPDGNGAEFQKVALPDQRRSGVLTHPLLMTSLAYHNETSPIHRGVFLARNVLGRSLRPPNEAFTPLGADTHPDMTVRERVALQTGGKACQGCHAMINPLGFSLEHFDAVGRFRKEERNAAVDASGEYLASTGAAVSFEDAPSLARGVAALPEPSASFAERLFHHFVKQPLRAYGPDQPEALRRRFEENQFNMQTLAVEAATLAALGPQPSASP